MLSLTNSVAGAGDFFWPMIVREAGMAILFVPLTTLVIQDLKESEIGQASGLNNMMRQLGGSFRIVISITILDHRADFHRKILVEYMNPYSVAFQQRFP